MRHFLLILSCWFTLKGLSALNLTCRNTYIEAAFNALLNAFSKSGFEVPFFFHYDKYSYISRARLYFGINEEYVKTWFLNNSLNLPESKIRPILLDHMRTQYSRSGNSYQGFSPSFTNGVNLLVCEMVVAVGMGPSWIFNNRLEDTKLYEKGLKPEILLIPMIEYSLEITDFYLKHFYNASKLSSYDRISPPSIPIFDTALLKSYQTTAARLVKAVASIREERAIRARLDEEQKMLAALQDYEVVEIKLQEEDAETSDRAFAFEDIEPNKGQVGQNVEFEEIGTEKGREGQNVEHCTRCSATSFAFQRICDLLQFMKEKLKHVMRFIRNRIKRCRLRRK